MFDSVGLSFGSSLSSHVGYQFDALCGWFLTTIKISAARYVRLYVRCTQPDLSFGRSAIGRSVSALVLIVCGMCGEKI